MKPEISIIIPAYNVENFLHETIESILKQSFEKYEVIIIDDGSTDNTFQIMQNVAEVDKRIRIYTQSNQGVSTTRNNGIEKARGEYIFFVDGDDLVPQYALEKMYRSAKLNHSDIVVGQMVLFGMAGNIVNQSTVSLSRKRLIDRFDPLFINTYSVCNKLFKREYIVNNNIRFEQLRYAEDGLFQYTCFKFNPIISGANCRVYMYRQRIPWKSNSATQIGDGSLLKDLIVACQKIMNMAYDMWTKYIKEANVTDQNEFERITNQQKEYMSTIYKKNIDYALLGEVYRKIWLCKEDVSEIVSSTLSYWKKYLSDGEWGEVCRNHHDMDFSTVIPNREKLLANPIVSLVLAENLRIDEIGRMLNSIYQQRIVSFVIFLPLKYKKYVHQSGYHYENIFYIEGNNEEYLNNVTKQLKSTYVMYLTEQVYFANRSLDALLIGIKESDSDFVGIPYYILNGYSVKKSIISEDSYNKTKCSLVTFDKRLNNLDKHFSNKLFKVRSLRKTGLKLQVQIEHS